MTKALWWLKNLTFNLILYVQRSSTLTAVASHCDELSQSASQSNQIGARVSIICRLWYGIFKCRSICSKYRLFEPSLSTLDKLMEIVNCQEDVTII